MRPFDLSFRYKLPLWGGLLIVLSVAAVSSAMLLKAYEDLQRDVRISAEALGGALAKTLFSQLLHDDVWRAYEQINAVYRAGHVDDPMLPEAIFVVGPVGEIIVSTAPDKLPMLAGLDSLGPGYAELARALDRQSGAGSELHDFATTHQRFIVFPIREEYAQLGTLVLAYSRDVYLPRFRAHALHGALIGLLVLAVLLPINAYWGGRMAEPLVELARRMGGVVRGQPRDDAEPPRARYPYRDELGQLFMAYDAMLAEMREKALLERELLQTERLGAIGRLASGIAHEVNNPLGGMLMALDTLRQRGDAPASVVKTLDMLERGLKQIQETVAALLVQTRGQSRPLAADDLEDVRTLIHPQVTAKSQRLDWRIEPPAGAMPPAAACRQILINLLLNAVQASAEQAGIRVEVAARAGGLAIVVANQAPPIPPERLEHLFEPFVSGREGGTGLGLWVTYQIARQLGGRIAASCADGEVRFEVWLPLENAT